MTIEIKVPTLPESVADASVATWYKKPGEACSRDENLVDIETDKVVLEVVAPDDGALESILQEEGATVGAEDVLGLFKASAAASEALSPEPTPAPVAAEVTPVTTGGSDKAADVLSPSVRRLLTENNLDAASIRASGKDGRITRDDVERHLASSASRAAASGAAAQEIIATGPREEKRVPMTRLRKRVAERLLEVQQSSAILTTFNEINMKPCMDLRKKFKQQFEDTHGVRLGFMSFFVKAVVEALKRYPQVNASIDGDDVVYHGYFDIGIAVSGPRGLVVPVVRDADELSFAGVESAIRDYAQKARNNTLSMDDLVGGTFTVTNGGVFGSLMSTPIINPPQSAILGMHGINQRPVVEEGEIVIRPMMYVALSYDHRIIDGRESVTFLKTVKELVEDPARLLLEV